MSDLQIKEEQTATGANNFELVYDGPNVASGTMSARYVAEVITGINRAFSIVASEHDLGDQYELRVRDVEHASFHLVLEAVAFSKANPGSASAMAAGAAVGLNAITNVVSGAYRVVTDIGKLIYAKKQLKGRRVATIPTEFADGEVQLSAPDELVILTKLQYELLLGQRIDRQLSQIVSPLEQNRIDSFEIKRAGQEIVSVAATQRDYFDYFEITEEKSREAYEIVGTLNSLTKTSLRGTFYTADGIHVPYRYTGGDINQLFRGFSSREPIRVHGRVKYGSDGIPTSVEIEDMEPLQRSLID